MEMEVKMIKETEVTVAMETEVEMVKEMKVKVATEIAMETEMEKVKEADHLRLLHMWMTISVVK